MKKPTAKRLRNLIKDEKKATREYERYGYEKLSRDESSHKNFLEKRLREMKK